MTSRYNLMPSTVSEERRQAAFQRIDSLALPHDRKVKIKEVVWESRFQGIYVEYLLAEDPFQFREHLPSNQAFLRQGRELGLNLEVLLHGIPDEGITLALQPNDPALEMLADFARETALLYVNALAKHLHYNINNFTTIFAQERLLQFLQGEGEFRERSTRELVKEYLTPTEWRKHRPSDFEMEGEAYDLLKKRVHDQAHQNACLLLEKEPLLGEFRQLYQYYERNGGRLSAEDCARAGFNLSKRSDAQKLRDLMSTTADHLIQFGSRVGCSSFPTDEFVRFVTIHLDNYHVPIIGERVRRSQEARYFLRLEALPPEDVVFGNDSGCCIAVYENNLGKGTDVPFYQLDLASPLFGIYQELSGKKPKRTGIIPSFATINERQMPVLLENSIELSQSQNPLAASELKRLVIHATRYLVRFQQAAGFSGLAAGIGDFNTGKNYLPPELFVYPDYSKEELVKLPDGAGEDDLETPEFYSQVFTQDGFSKKGHWAYVNL